MMYLSVCIITSLFLVGWSADAYGKFVCPEKDGLFADPQNKCSKLYWWCVDNYPSPLECKDEQIFDEKSQSCSSNLDGCSEESKTTTEINFDCSELIDGFYADPENDCGERYFSCTNRKPTEWYCRDAGTVFDVVYQRCDYPWYIAACGGEPTSSVMTTVAQEPAIDFNTFDCQGKAPGNYPDPEYQCSHFFYTCSEGHPLGKRQPCASDTYFDGKDCYNFPEVYACSGNYRSTDSEPTTTNTPATPYPFDCPYTGEHPDPENACSNRYVGCGGGVAHLMYCPEDLKFDPELKSCHEAKHVPVCGGERPTTTLSPQSEEVTKPYEKPAYEKLYEQGQY